MNQKASFRGIEFEIGDHRVPLDILVMDRSLYLNPKWTVKSSLESYQLLRKNPGKRLKMTHVTGREYVIERPLVSQKFRTLQNGEVEFNIEDISF